MYRNIVSLVALFSFTFSSYTLAQTPILVQTPSHINVKVDGLGSDTVYLAHYYGAKLFYNDTTVADSHGTFSFKGKPYEECGKYAIVLPGPVFFDIMLTNEPMVFQTSLENPQGDMMVLKSKENKVFYDYIAFLNEKRIERGQYLSLIHI